MIYEASPFAIGLFIAFVLGVLGISSYFAKKTQSSKGYYGEHFLPNLQDNNAFLHLE